jgi:hypothetical protein
MRKFISRRAMPLVVMLGLGTLSIASGCSGLQALAKDEKTAASYLSKMGALAKSGSAPSLIATANDQMLALDPSSALLQKIHSMVAQAIAAGDLSKIAEVCAAASVMLNGVAAITSAA